MKNLTIKEHGEAFFIKDKNTTIAAFHKREHAEFFLNYLNEQEEEKQLGRQASKHQAKEGIN